MTPALQEKFTVAISKDFFRAFAAIPYAQQMKVHRFVEKFEQSPAAASINYEQIANVKDSNLRSVRIDQDYRAIVAKPNEGNVYILLYVDHHDKAYRWAQNKVVKVNSECGALQLVDLETAEQTYKESGAKENRASGLLADVRDKVLMRFGVPEEYLQPVKAAATQNELAALFDRLPEEASEALFLLATGSSIEEAFRSLEKEVSAPAPIDTANFIAALEQDDSRRQFYVVENEKELSSMLNAPLEQWRVFLHPTQRKIVQRNWSGPVRVLGGAGTGKTVVAMHRAKYLAEKVFKQPSDRILFTTYTANLAADIADNLSKICTPEDLQRIEVKNIDGWVFDFLKQRGYRRNLILEPLCWELWELASSVAPAEPVLETRWFKEEWDKVIQPNGIVDRQGYLTVSRAGRGGKLTRKERDGLWNVFEEYRELLNARGLKEFVDATRDARQLLEKNGDILPYKAIIVDEAQDMGPETFKLLRQMLPGGTRANDLFIVGDAHQRIYDRRATLSSCGVDIRGRGRKLRINYRCTDETRKWAMSILTDAPVDDLDGDTDDSKQYTSLMFGERPKLQHFSTFEEEAEHIASVVKTLQEKQVSLANICVVGRTDDILTKYERSFNNHGIETYRIRRSAADERKNKGLRLATMHRVKGLQFDHVIIVSANQSVLPLEEALRHASNEQSRNEIEMQERRLLHVAATRAKQTVYVTSFGTRSDFLKEAELCATL